MLAQWEADDVYGRIRRRCRGPAALRAGRRPALCQRPDPPRPRRQQGPQGHGREVEDPVGLRRAVHPGLGLPRPAHRARGGEEARQGGQEARCREVPRGLPRATPVQQVDSQRRDFRRLGVLGDWDRPYLTLDPRFEANQVRGFAQHHRQRPRAPRLQAGALVPRLRLGAGRGGGRVRSTRPRPPSTSALPSSTPGLLPAARRATAVQPVPPLSIPIWTTTPWTLPANQAVALGPELTYVLVEATLATGRERLVLAADLADAALARYGATRCRDARGVPR